MGRHFERVSLASSDSRGYHSLLPKCPQGWNRECGPLRGALPRAHPQPQASPFFSPFTLHAQAASAPLPGRDRTRKPLSEFGLVLSGALELSGGLRLPRALKRNWRCRSLLSPAATLARQVLPSFRKGCVSGNGPALSFRYQPNPKPGRGVVVRTVALGSPHSCRLLGSSVCRPAGHDCQDNEMGTGHLPAAHSSLRSVTFHPSFRQQARE